jgi:hypothetical protein
MQGIYECTYTESDVMPGFQYFASKVSSCLQPLAVTAAACQHAAPSHHLTSCASAIRLQVLLGPGGIEKFEPLPELSEFEQQGLVAMKELLTANIQAGVEFANKA